MSTSVSAPRMVVYEGKMGLMARLRDDTIVSLSVEDVPDGPDRMALDNPEVPLSIRSSTDHGATWGEPRVACRYPAGRGVSTNPYALVSPDGLLHIEDTL